MPQVEPGKSGYSMQRATLFRESKKFLEDESLQSFNNFLKYLTVTLYYTFTLHSTLINLPFITFLQQAIDGQNNFIPDGDKPVKTPANHTKDHTYSFSGLYIAPMMNSANDTPQPRYQIASQSSHFLFSPGFNGCKGIHYQIQSHQNKVFY